MSFGEAIVIALMVSVPGMAYATGWIIDRVLDRRRK